MSARIYDFGLPLVTKAMQEHAYALHAGRSKLLVEAEAETTMARLARAGYSRRYCLEVLTDCLEEARAK